MNRKLVFIAGILFCTSLSVSSNVFAVQSCPWPTSKWYTDKMESHGINQAKFAELEKFIFADDKKTDGLLLIRDGCLLFERYGRGFNKDMKHVAWSISKSITSALAGIGEKRGLFHREDLVKTYLPYFDKPGHDKLKIKHLMHMRSGIRWTESYSNIITSDAISMLYTSGFKDTAKYTAENGMEFEPGNVFEYASGDTNSFMAIIASRMDKSEAVDFPWTMLFDPIGMKDSVFERDLAGNFIGATAFFSTPKDFARFGYLFLKEGQWDGKEIVPKEWVKWSTSLPKENGAKSRASYGAWWWLNKEIPEDNKKMAWPDLPEGAFAALGYQGQHVLVIPSLDIVLVRTGSEKSGALKINDYAKLLMDAVKKTH